MRSSFLPRVDGNVILGLVRAADLQQHAHHAFVAPLCKGPFRAPRAEVMAECMSDRVEAVTRAQKVEALML